MSKGIFAGFAIFAILMGSAGVYLILSAPEQGNNVMGADEERVITLVEIAEHATADDCWTAIGGKVYEIHSFILQHPGGDEILKACGKDGTEEFGSRQHSSTARAILKTLEIGVLDN